MVFGKTTTTPQPTKGAVAITTSLATLTTTGMDIDPDEDANGVILLQLEEIGYLGPAFLVVVALILTCISSICYKINKISNVDQPSLLLILIFFANIGDFVTDLVFSAILWFQDDEITFYNVSLAYWSVLFTIGPYLLSLFVCCVFNTYWKRKDERLKIYVSKYGCLIFIVSMIAGYYSTIALFKSQIFFCVLFHFPLKQKEYNHLKNIKFINIVLLEVCLCMVLHVFARVCMFLSLYVISLLACGACIKTQPANYSVWCDREQKMSGQFFFFFAGRKSAV